MVMWRYPRIATSFRAQCLQVPLDWFGDTLRKLARDSQVSTARFWFKVLSGHYEEVITGVPGYTSQMYYLVPSRSAWHETTSAKPTRPHIPAPGYGGGHLSHYLHGSRYYIFKNILSTLSISSSIFYFVLAYFHPPILLCIY